MRTAFWISMLGLFLVGCVTPRAQPEISMLMNSGNLEAAPHVLDDVTVTTVAERRIALPGGSSLLQVQFAVTADSDTRLAWRIIWFDNTGMVVADAGEAYRKVSLLEDQTRYFKAVAPHARVVSYTLQLRQPNAGIF